MKNLSSVVNVNRFFFFVGSSGKPSKGHKVIPLFMLKTRGFAGFPGIAIGTA